jgi:hypothetical protein
MLVDIYKWNHTRFEWDLVARKTGPGSGTSPFELVAEKRPCTGGTYAALMQAVVNHGSIYMPRISYLGPKWSAQTAIYDTDC